MDATNVLISCLLDKNKEEFIENYYISHSEMNKIIGELQQANPDQSIYEAFTIVQLNETEVLYSLDLAKNNIVNSYIPESNYHFMIENATQVRP